MKLAVTDSNIFIDLFYLKSVPLLFRIGFEIMTTDDILEELREDQSQEMIKFMQSGLLIVETIRKEDTAALLKWRTFKGLSEYDLSVLYLAEKHDAIILSGDNLIRKTCQKKDIEIHGILWCLHQFTEYQLIEKETACLLLKRLMSFNKRLPLKNCKEYITEEWGGEWNEN